VTDPEVDYGHHWQLPSGQRARLSWNEATGVLYLLHPVVGPDPLVLVPERHAVEELLAGWEDSQGSLEWLHDRLWIVGARLPSWAVPVSRGG
jgi:hypothetical protein